MSILNNQKTTLGQLRICTERTLLHDSGILKRIMRATTHSHRSKLRAAFYQSKLWPKNTAIKYCYLSDPDSPEIPRDEVQNSQGEPDPLENVVKTMKIGDAIKLIVKERIEPITNLSFVFVTDPFESDIRISFDINDGAWSLLGIDAKYEDKSKPTMNLGWFNVATVIHEFGHVLGMIHEHQNISGHPIEWDVDKLYAWAAETQGWSKEDVDVQILQKYDHTQVNGSNFDPKSIMLYFFPASVTLNNTGTNQNLRLSKTDVDWILRKYPGPKITPREFLRSIYSSSDSSIIDKFYDYLMVIIILCIVVVIMNYLKNQKVN